MNPGNPRNAGRKPGSSLVREVPPPNYPDFSSFDGAHRLKRALENYYRDNSLPIPEFRVQPMPHADKGGQTIWTVRSNLKNGLPT
jgi:hypothetical protein